MRTPLTFRVFLALAIVALARPAYATFHLWQISQVYSNASGSVQYIDFFLPSAPDNEQFLGGRALTSSLHTLTFGANLPSMPVPGQHFLVGTPGFASLANVTPDYTFPEVPGTPFFNLNGDTINYASVDSFTFPSGGIPALPHDGIHALNRNGTTSLNAPTNFAGRIGFVPEPATWVLLLSGAGCLWIANRARRRRVSSLNS
jgi:serralysin